MILDNSVTLSKTLQFSQKARELKDKGRRIISLGIGEPDFDTPDHIKQAAVNALAQGMTRYSNAQGLPGLRELVAAKLNNENKIEAHASDIIITPGAKNALFLACAALLEPGDEVVNITPCYVSNIPILKIAEPASVIRNVPMNRETFTLVHEDIAEAVNRNTKLIFINFPNNPAGTMISDDDISFLAELSVKNKLYILSDEIYEKITISSKRHISPASIGTIKDRVITVGGFSKAYAMTGWRIGYVHARQELIAKMLKIHQHLNTHTATFIQKAAIAAIEGSQSHLQEFIANLKKRREMFAGFLSDNFHLKGPLPDGGFFCFMNIEQTGLSSDDFCTGLLDRKGVAVIPGISFGEQFDDHVRVSLVNTNDEVREGLQFIDEYVNEVTSGDE